MDKKISEDYFQNASLIIVKSSGKEAKYAQILLQILEQYPNVKSPQPITESQYNASFPTIGKNPSAKIIFVGNGKEIEAQGKAVKWIYNHFGMKYGWLGNRCVITVSSDELSPDNQHEFATYYNGKIKELKSLMDNVEFSKINYSELQKDKVNKKYNEIIGEVKNKAVKTALNVVLSPFKGGMNALDNAIQDTRATIKGKDIWKRQYELLVCEFILNGFEIFMNNTVEKKPRSRVIIVYDNKNSWCAHLLNNLIHQYSNYNVIELLEKMYTDNTLDISKENKIIFLGQTKTSKECQPDNLQYKFDESGMHYGWSGSHAFVNIKTLKKDEIEKFTKIYQEKRKKFEHEAEAYYKGKSVESLKNGATALGVLNVATSPVLGILMEAIAVAAVTQVAGEAIDYAKTVSDLKKYQYELLLREFVFNGFKGFMEGQ